MNVPSKDLKELLAFYQQNFEQAEDQVKVKYERVRNSFEFRDYQSSLSLKNEAQEKLLQVERDLKSAELDQKINALKARGFEARTGHTTGSTNHRDWQSDDGEPWTWIICHQSCPKLIGVSESSHDVWYTWEGVEVNQNAWEIGNGKTEQEAWEDAALADEEDIKQALVV